MHSIIVIVTEKVKCEVISHGIVFLLKQHSELDASDQINDFYYWKNDQIQEQQFDKSTNIKEISNSRERKNALKRFFVR